MRNFKLIFSAVLFVLINITVSAQKHEAYKIEQYKLSNGLTVILSEDHSLPQAYGAVVVCAGSINDPVDATGLAHYLEHMLFKGTQNMGTTNWEKEKPYYEKALELYDELYATKDKKQRESLQKEINKISLQQSNYVIPNEYSKLLSEIGTDGINAGTGYDYTTYYSKFPAVQIEKWLTFYSNSFQNPVFRGFQAELETVYEEYNMYKDRHYERFNEEIQQHVFPTSPYGRPIIGLGEHLKNPSLRKLIDFYQTYYVPENMALVISGNININEVKPHIENTFGKWENKKLTATQPDIKEASFKGRKEITIRNAPNEMVQLVYRTVPSNHPDKNILDVCDNLLNNGQTGLLDQLIIDGTFVIVNTSNGAYKNDGVMTLAAIPNPQAFYKGSINPMGITTIEQYNTYIRELDRARIIAIEETEKKMITALQRLSNGSFSDQLLDGVKSMLINQYIRMQEFNNNKLMYLVNTFANNIDIKEYTDYINKINAITKDDIVQVAKKYFGKNYMVFVTKYGKGKTEKLEKPNVDPLEFNATGESVFAKEFRAIKSPELNPHYVNFEKDAEKLQLKNGDSFYFSKNPVNDIFSLVIRFDIGTELMKELNYVYLLNYGGAGGFTPQIFKTLLSNLNCSYSISATESYLTINLSGPEKNFKQATELLSLLINQPIVYQNNVSAAMERERILRRYEKSDAESIIDALNSYIMYGEKSPYIDRLTLKAVGQIKTQEIIMAFQQACKYSATVFCSGNWISGMQARAAFEQTVQLNKSPLKGDSPFIRPKANITENTIYFVHSSDLKQSQMRVFANEGAYDISQNPLINAFNFYFSGSFNGLMLQEIREKRSMAYYANANYVHASLSGKDSHFEGELQTQSDKTNSTIDAFWSILRDMPKYTERMQAIKNYLTWSSILQTPSFRAVGIYIDYYNRIGYVEDPVKSNIEAYENLEFEDIVKFWINNIKDKPMAMAIVGDKSRVNLKELSKYGKLVEINPDKLFSKDEE